MMVGVLMLLMLFLLAAVGWRLVLGWPWIAAVLVSAVLFARQLASVRTRDRDACFKAFLENNWVGVMIFLGALGHFILAGAYSSG
jgi:4-hydroxybenzoate polyprenyltransferase